MRGLDFPKVIKPQNGTHSMVHRVAEVVAEVVVEEVIEVAGVEVEVVEEVVSKAEAEEALVASQVAGINHSAPIPRRDSLSASC